MPKQDPGSKSKNTEQPYAQIYSADPIPEAATLDPEEVARLAYSYWEARGRDGGSPEEDWFKAENELKMRATSSA
jgi:hypothetical protein